MCRLLAVLAPKNITVHQALGDTELNEFTQLSAFHNDGWGGAWQTHDGNVHIIKSTQEAACDRQYTHFADDEASDSLLLHFRWASDNMANTSQNAHPFLYENTAMIHNGNIAPIGKLDRMLNAQMCRTLRGSTDSERFFAYIMQCIHHDGDFEGGLVHAVEMMRDRFPGRSLNSMLLHDGKIYVINVHDGAPFDLSHDRYRRDLAAWYHDRRHYHTLVMSEQNGAMIVASTGIRDGQWEELRDESIVVLEHKRARPSIRTLWKA